MKRKITYASARDKGKSAERLVAKYLCGIGIQAKRVPMSGALAWLKGDVREFNTEQDHVHEVKNHEELSLGAWWDQAIAQVEGEQVPVLHFTSSYKPMYTMLDSKTFDDMLFAYELKRTELKIQVINLPNRKNFWKFSDKQRHKYTIFYTVEERVIMPFELYLLLRRYSVVWKERPTGLDFSAESLLV